LTDIFFGHHLIIPPQDPAFVKAWQNFDVAARKAQHERKAKRNKAELNKAKQSEANLNEFIRIAPGQV
jgi:hypothetical protein